MHAFVCCRYLKEEDRILYDCGLGKGEVNGVFMAPTKGPKGRSETMTEKAYNDMVRRSRTIVEHTYGRLKNKWPILKYFRLEPEKLDDTFTACNVLCNIDQEYDNPLRYTKCRKPRCAYCDHDGA